MPFKKETKEWEPTSERESGEREGEREREKRYCKASSLPTSEIEERGAAPSACFNMGHATLNPKP